MIAAQAVAFRDAAGHPRILSDKSLRISRDAETAFATRNCVARRDSASPFSRAFWPAN